MTVNETPEDFPEESTPEVGLMLSNRAYDILNPITRLYLPLLIGFYGTMSQIWKWPLEVQLLATFAAVQVLLSGIVTLSSRVYKNSDAKFDGTLHVIDTDEKTIIRAGGVDPELLLDKDAVMFKVLKVNKRH